MFYSNFFHVQKSCEYIYVYEYIDIYGVFLITQSSKSEGLRDPGQRPEFPGEYIHYSLEAETLAKESK